MPSVLDPIVMECSEFRAFFWAFSQSPTIPPTEDRGLWLRDCNSRVQPTVWAALCGNGVIIGPYFFEGNVNGTAYLRMFNEFVFPQLAEYFNNQYWEGRFRGLWWAQDGTPAHRLIAVRDRLIDVFGNNGVIGLGHDVEWPPRSPDLTPCDFFLWGYMKDKVFSTPPRDIDDHIR